MKKFIPSKIFIFCELDGGGYIGQALAEDGIGLGNHMSSSPSFSKRDMGVDNPTSPKHVQYREHYPNGYELVWCDYGVDLPADCLKAIGKNLALPDEAFE